MWADFHGTGDLSPSNSTESYFTVRVDLLSILGS